MGKIGRAARLQLVRFQKRLSSSRVCESVCEVFSSSREGAQRRHLSDDEHVSVGEEECGLVREGPLDQGTEGCLPGHPKTAQ